MKTLGIIGGIGPESTIEYYQFIIKEYRELQPDGSYPLIIINSLNLKKYIDLGEAGRFGDFVEPLVAELHKLKNAGADFALFAANTPHIVFDQIEARSPLPLLSIVEATCKEAQKLGLHKVGLLGTGFTMKGKIYPETFARAGMTVVVPNAEEQTYIHEKYIGELLKSVFLPETRGRLLTIVEAMKRRDAIQGLILGGTELPLILRGADAGIPFLDTTTIHVKAAVAEMLS
jgi:aspartate racemase